MGKLRIYCAIAAISFIQGLQYCVSPVLGQIQAQYPSVDVSLVQMLITAPALLAMAVAVISGWLVVRVSKKRLLLFGSLAAGVLGFLPLLSGSFALLFLSRILYGVPLGLATALNTAVVADFFEGEERVKAMGVQAASVGAGMVVVTTMVGALGAGGFRNAYFIHIIAFFSLAAIALCLPDTGKVRTAAANIRLNRQVFQVAAFGLLEFLFLITFTTNIAMHLGGPFAGDSTVSGVLTGIFSGAQILVGLVLGGVVRITGKYTLPAAMLSFSAGGVILILFPANLPMLVLGAVLCGFSQGVFVPQAMVDVSNAVSPASTAMAAACFTCATCLGQFLSPAVLNTAASALFGEATTGRVYLAAVTGMAASAMAALAWKRQSK